MLLSSLQARHNPGGSRAAFTFKGPQVHEDNKQPMPGLALQTELKACPAPRQQGPALGSNCKSTVSLPSRPCPGVQMASVLVEKAVD